MLVTKTKPLEEIISKIGERPVIIRCEGCSEVCPPSDTVDKTISEIMVMRPDVTVITANYICNEKHLQLHITKYGDIIERSGSIVVFSCGVGVQTVAELIYDKYSDTVTVPHNADKADNIETKHFYKHHIEQTKHVISACDTHILPGYQGLSTAEFNCVLCGDCQLNTTGGLCPKTVCLKELTSGQCGGARNGMCEVDKNHECGWVRIALRLDSLNSQKS